MPVASGSSPLPLDKPGRPRSSAAGAPPGVPTRSGEGARLSRIGPRGTERNKMSASRKTLFLLLAAAFVLATSAEAQVGNSYYAQQRGMDERFRLDIGGFFQKFDTTVSVEGSDGTPRDRSQPGGRPRPELPPDEPPARRLLAVRPAREPRLRLPGMAPDERARHRPRHQHR